MNADVKAKWLAALRSGEYEQAQGYLGRTVTNENGEQVMGYCCLGVLCQVAVAEGVILPPETIGDERGDMLAYGSDEVDLPVAVQQWAGLDNADPGVRTPEGARDAHFYVGSEQPNRTTLASLNDADGFTFAQIADVIEEQF